MRHQSRRARHRGVPGAGVVSNVVPLRPQIAVVRVTGAPNGYRHYATRVHYDAARARGSSVHVLCGKALPFGVATLVLDGLTCDACSILAFRPDRYDATGDVIAGALA